MTRTLSQPAWMVLAVALFTAGAQQAQAEIAWQTQLKTAHAQAQQEGKLLLLHFYDDNCVWCDRLESGAFKAPEVAAAIQKNYVPVKIHAGKSPSIASTFQVTRYPTDVIVTTQGQAVSHSVSPQDPARYVAMLTQHAQPSGAAIASVSPVQAPVAAAATAPSQPTNAIAGTPGQGAGYVVPPASKEIVATPVSVRTDNSLQTPAPTSVAARSEMELAMEGYCSVAVIDEDRWVEGNPEFGVVHLGRLYLFSSKPAMERFVANPEPYTPMLNGIDVVRFFEERKIVPGNREWGLKDPDHNRMFFFADEAALNHFYNQHTRYTDAALAVMDKAIKDANPPQ